MTSKRYALAAVAGAAVLVVGGGAALAGQRGNEPGSRCEALLTRIAERRGVTVAELEAQIKARLEARVDVAVQAGRITPTQGAALKQRIEAGSVCGGIRRAHLRGGMLKAAADYLGMTRAELRAKLPGTSLAAIAQAEGKSVSGLEDAMLAPAKARLANAVQNKLLTQAQADRALGRLTTFVDKLVQKTFPAKP